MAVPEHLPVPQIAMHLTRDSEDGFNLHVELQNFRLESPALRDTRGEGMLRGHAHLYLNGVKLTRLYGNDLHLPSRLFRSGINSLQISINDHERAVYAINREPIQATILMNPEVAQFQLSHYSSSPISSKP